MYCRALLPAGADCTVVHCCLYCLPEAACCPVKTTVDRLWYGLRLSFAVCFLLVHSFDTLLAPRYPSRPIPLTSRNLLFLFLLLFVLTSPLPASLPCFCFPSQVCVDRQPSHVSGDDQPRRSRVCQGVEVGEWCAVGGLILGV